MSHEIVCLCLCEANRMQVSKMCLKRDFLQKLYKFKSVNVSLRCMNIFDNKVSQSEGRTHIFTGNYSCSCWTLLRWFASDPPAAAAAPSGWTWSVCRVVTDSRSPSSFLWTCWSPPGLRPRSSSSRWRLVPFPPAGPQCCSDLCGRRGLKTDHGVFSRKVQIPLLSEFGMTFFLQNTVTFPNNSCLRMLAVPSSKWQHHCGLVCNTITMKTMSHMKTEILRLNCCSICFKMLKTKN